LLLVQNWNACIAVRISYPWLILNSLWLHGLATLTKEELQEKYKELL